MLHDLTAAFNSVQKFPYTLTCDEAWLQTAFPRIRCLFGQFQRRRTLAKTAVTVPKHNNCYGRC